MFFLYTIQDRIIVSASLLGQDLATVVRGILKQKFIGKVLTKEGLCISLNYFHVTQTLVYSGEGDLLVSVPLANKSA